MYPPVIVFKDNIGAMQSAQKRLSPKRTKHLDVHFHLVRDLVRWGEVGVRDVATETPMGWLSDKTTR